MKVHLGLHLSIKFSGTCLHTWVQGGIVRLNFSAKEHNAGQSTTPDYSI